MVEDYVKLMASSTVTGNISIPTLLGLAVAMGLLRVREVAGGERFLYPSSPNAIERPYHHKRLLDLPSQRSANVGILLAIPEAKNFLNTFERSLQ